ncbi:hypothetical protein Tco_0979959 [Tanacetum coccineum]
MASLDHRLNPLFSIKECMSCGALYTRNCGCSKGSLEDKILVPKPPQNCATCGNPVDGLYCRPCAFVRKCLNEGWYTIHDENEILNTSESSNHNTNVVSALREPFVFNQDPGVNSSQNPLQSNHNCCYECGDSLDDIFCQRCTCKSCGNGAHIGYNCPPKAPIISNPEQCNQTINELPQTLPSVHPTCNSEDENSFTYNSKPNSVDNSPNVFNHPPQPPMYSCEFCGNDARYGHYCTPQVPEPCYNQDFNFPREVPLKESLEGSTDMQELASEEGWVRRNFWGGSLRRGLGKYTGRLPIVVSSSEDKPRALSTVLIGKSYPLDPIECGSLLLELRGKDFKSRA